MLRAAEGNPSIQRDLQQMCTESVLFWINMFAWTYRQRDMADDGSMRGAVVAHVPFVTWPSQDVAFLDLRADLAIGMDSLVTKSREEGATWICIADNHHLWQFRPDSQIIEVSRVEDLVDKTGDPLALFWKHDYLNRFQPQWLLPADRKLLCKKGSDFRKYMVIINPENGSTITGMASTEHIARGGRYLRAFFDEMAMMASAAPAWRSAADAAVQRVANSTPYGPGTEYSRLREEGLDKGRPHVISLMYWNNPEKGRGRQWKLDEDGSITGDASTGYWDTPWLHWRLKQAEGDTMDVGQNVFANDIQSGDSVFRPSAITKHREEHAREPTRAQLSECGKFFEPTPTGNWYIYVPLRTDGCFERTCFDDCVCFLDPSHGKGASNTAAAFLTVGSGEFIAEFVDPFCSPVEVANELCPALRGVFRGRHGPCFIEWEENGPGENLYHEFINVHKYRKVYRRRRLGGTQDGRSRNYGWRSGRREKRILLQRLGGDITRQTVTIYSAACLGEMLRYVFFPDGSCGPGVMRDKETGAREEHGDRVIAAAGCVFMRREVGKWREGKPVAYVRGSMGFHLGHNTVLGLE